MEVEWEDWSLQEGGYRPGGETRAVVMGVEMREPLSEPQPAGAARVSR